MQHRLGCTQAISFSATPDLIISPPFAKSGTCEERRGEISGGHSKVASRPFSRDAAITANKEFLVIDTHHLLLSGKSKYCFKIHLDI